MPLDFRYHLASLTAVFGALIIGILLGVAMKEGPALSNQVDDLRKDLHRYDSIHNIDERTDMFNTRIQSVVLHNRLFGRNVLLVANPLASASETLPAVRRTLEESGAVVTCEVTLKPAFQVLTRDQIASLCQQANITDMPTKPDVSDFLNILAINVGNENGQLVSLMQNAKLLKFTGDPLKPVSAIVYLGGISDKGKYVTSIDLPFLRGCAHRGISFAATESVESTISAMQDYQKIAPITVDNIDRAAGRIALVLALSTGQHGHYGYKETADDVVPECD